MSQGTLSSPDSTTSTPSSIPLRAYAILFMGLAAVALAAIFIRAALAEGVPALVIAASRLVLAVLMLTPFTLRRYQNELRSLRRNDIFLLLIAGIFLAIHFATWVSSLQYTSVLISGVLVTTTPIWVGILEVLILKMPLTRGIVIGLAIALVGSLIIALPASNTGNSTVETTPVEDTALIGGLLAAAGAMTVAVYLIVGRRLRSRLSLLPYIWSVYGTAAVVLSLVVLVAGLPVTGYPASAYLWLLLLAIFPQLLGHSSFNYVLAYMPATYISLTTQLEPLGAALVAFVVFQETPAPTQMLGSVVVMGGVLLATLNPWRSRRLDS